MSFFRFCISVLLVALALTGCSTKQSAINQLEDYSYELRDNARYYSVSDWEKSVDKFVKIRKKIAKHGREYTTDEKKHIGELEGQCAGYMAKGAKNGLLDGIRSVGNEINGIIEGIRDAIAE